MPSVSAAQHRAMEAAAHGHSNIGIPREVGEEFSRADKGKTFDAEPLIAAGILFVTPDNRVLVLLRSDAEPNFGGYWALPGGKADDGETPQECALREAGEEIGSAAEHTYMGDLTLADEASFPTGTGAYSTFIQPVRYAFEPELNSEHSGYAWVSPGSLPTPMHPSVERVIGKIFPSEEMSMDARRVNFDKASIRREDEDGHLHVEMTPISKANVCPYYGHEIPDYDKMGLDPNKTYRLWRHPDELKKAAESFAGKPLLNEHTPVSAEDHPKDKAVGSIGSEVEFRAPYLMAPLTVWDKDSIDRIKSGEQKELSSGYRYRADMTPGTTPDGEPYDGIMRDISGNHLALVPEGRAGSDVVVGDRKPASKYDATKLAYDADFEESKHPRASNGQFGSGGGASSENESRASKPTTHKQADDLAAALKKRGIPVSEPSHSTNRYGQNSSYIDTPVGRIRVSDHSKNENFNDAAINVASGTDFDLEKNADAIASAIKKANKDYKNRKSDREAVRKDFSKKFKAAKTDADRDETAKSYAAKIGARKWGEMSREDRKNIRRELARDESVSEKETARGKFSEKDRETASSHVQHREDMPESAFLEPSSRKYPVKEKKDGAWKYDRELLLAAARRARINGNEALANRADAIRKREFGGAQDRRTVIPNSRSKELSMANKGQSRKAAAAEGALVAYLLPKLAQDAKLDIHALVRGVNDDNFGARKASLVTKVERAVKGKLAQDADVGDLAELLDALEAHEDVLEDSATEANSGIPAAKEVEEDEEMESPKDRLKNFLKGKLSEDDMGTCDEMLSGWEDDGQEAMDEDDDERRDNESEGEHLKARERREKEEAEDEDKVDKKAMDAAITAMRDQMIRNQRETREAERHVRPYVGDLAMAHDSAEAVYRTALGALGVKDVAKLPAAALKPILDNLPLPGAGSRTETRAAMATDSAAVNSFYELFPEAKNHQVRTV